MKDHRKRVFICLGVSLLFILALSTAAFTAERMVLFSEYFNDLRHWKPFYFRKITRYSDYRAGLVDGVTCLVAMSNSSASAIVHERTFDVYRSSRLRWRWMIEHVYEKGNALKKSGDDYPIRIYIMFRYDPEKASLGKRLKYGLAKKIYGRYPPHNTLNYIWANRQHDKDIITNPYADEARMVVLRWGDREAGKWVEEEINLLDDYRRAFGEDPPHEFRIAVMNDSDNTGEHSVSYIDFIEFLR